MNVGFIKERTVLQTDILKTKNFNMLTGWKPVLPLCHFPSHKFKFPRGGNCIAYLFNVIMYIM